MRLNQPGRKISPVLPDIYDLAFSQDRHRPARFEFPAGGHRVYNPGRCVGPAGVDAIQPKKIRDLLPVKAILVKIKVSGLL